MSIRLKILLACLTLTVITAVSGVIARTSQAELGGLAFRLYDEAFMSMSYLRSAQNSTLSLSRDLTSSEDVNRALADEKLEATLSDLQVAQDRALSPEGKAATVWLQERIALLRRQIEVDLPVDRKLLGQLEDRFDTAVEINAGDGFRSRRQTVALVDHVERQTWVITGVSVAVALLITILLSRAIVPSVQRAVGIATSIAAGRLDNPIPTGGSGETAVLLSALSTMQHSIADKITEIERLMDQQASSHANEIAVQHVRFETALENMIQGLCLLDDHRRVVVHNRQFGLMFAPATVGTPLSSVLPPVLVDASEGDRQSRTYTRELDDERIIAVSERPMESGGWVVTYEDVSERHRNEARMAHLARHDVLTGLPNRLSFQERLNLVLADPRQVDGIAVMCFNLDHFKTINDTLGHSVGDAMLREVATRLVQGASDEATVFRLGGDEFGIIQCAAPQPTNAKQLAERLSAAIAEPITLNGHQVTIGTSIGMATHGVGSTDADTLLKNADIALDRAKAEGRGIYRFFESEMDALMQARRRLETDLRQAVERGEFVVYYQPLITTKSRRVSGFEALVRWQHPTRGMVSPAEFIPVAEEIGLIGRLGAIVLEHACRDAATWPADIKVAVNLSPQQFRNSHLADDVAAELTRSGLLATRLELEITESVMLQDNDVIMATLHAIKSLGVQISMDDFGTGFSSLSYLRRFPFDKIKIDQSFIRNLTDSNDCMAIVRAVIGLGRSLGMKIVAEGVETEEQFQLLRQEGCEQLQGYLFSKPQPLAAATLLISGAGREAA